jgi:hypothetical protein
MFSTVTRRLINITITVSALILSISATAEEDFSLGSFSHRKLLGSMDESIPGQYTVILNDSKLKSNLRASDVVANVKSVVESLLLRSDSSRSTGLGATIAQTYDNIFRGVLLKNVSKQQLLRLLNSHFVQSVTTVRCAHHLSGRR